jgi:hypothetical protein
MKLEFQMQTKAGNDDRAADAIVAGVIDVLQIEGSENAAPNVGRVVTLLNRLAPVTERSISQQKS